MSLRVEWLPLSVAGLLALVPAPPLAAQTIADYSRAQRALLEANMTQAAARSAGIGASTPASAATVAAPALQRPLPPTEPVVPAVRVSGVFASASRTMAEVAVDGNRYLLGAGQSVPGTVWSVDAITAERVVLTRRAAGEGGAAGNMPPLRQIHDLPALR